MRRISSRDFCRTLVSNPVIVDGNTEMLSPIIIDSAWFFLSWKKDPTIDAMLRTIDDIHTKFYEVDNLWDKLTSDDNLVSFYHVDLEDIGLTDDLYIKMNNQWETSSNFLQTFANKIDTIWTDLFWFHRKGYNIDEAFIRFISTIVMVERAIEKTDDRFTVISKLQENPNSVKTNMFSKASFDYLCECFDLYYSIYKNNQDIHIDLPLFQHKPDKTIFSSIISEGSNASYTQKVLFYAQTEYLRKVSDFNSSNFHDWMRVVRNIVSRGDVTKNGKRPAIIRSPQTFDGVIKLIHELSEGCEDIYSYLSSRKQLKSTFAKEQIEEEKTKAQIITGNIDSRKVIFDTEDTNLLQGRIEFALYCVNYDSKKKNLDIPLLRNFKDVLSNYFHEESDVNNNLRRALLTIDNNGEYNYYGYWWSFWNVVSANKRCLIDKYREVEYFIYGNYKNRDEYRVYFKKLMLLLIDNTLEQISSNFEPPLDMPNWKVRLIKENELLDDKSKSNYIAIPKNQNCCYLLKSMRPRDIDGCEKIE